MKSRSCAAGGRRMYLDLEPSRNVVAASQVRGIPPMPGGPDEVLPLGFEPELRLSGSALVRQDPRNSASVQGRPITASNLDRPRLLPFCCHADGDASDLSV